MDRFSAFGCTVAGNTLNAVKMPGMTFPWERDSDIIFHVDDLTKKLVDYEKAAKEDYGMQGTGRKPLVGVELDHGMYHGKSGLKCDNYGMLPAHEFFAKCFLHQRYDKVPTR